MTSTEEKIDAILDAISQDIAERENVADNAMHTLEKMRPSSEEYKEANWRRKIEYQLNIKQRGVKIESSPVHFARLTPYDVPLLYRIRHKLSGTRTLNSMNFSVMLHDGVGHPSIYRKTPKISLFLG